MTRKDYVLLAEAMKLPAACKGDYALGRIDAALKVADALAADNPRFDADRFLRAAGVRK